MTGLRVLESVSGQLRYAVRSMLRRPALSFVAVATLGTLTRFVLQIGTLDLVAFVAAPLLLVAAALLATLIPAHRVGRVDPMRVLRAD